MKTVNVIKKLEKNGFWVKNTVNDWYEAINSKYETIKFGGREEVDSFQVGLSYYPSLKKALERSMGKYNVK